MSQSLVNNLIHLVSSTKHRQPWISKDHRDGLFAYQAGIFQEWDSPALMIGGMEDHRSCVVRPFQESLAEKDHRGGEEGKFEVDEDRRPKES